MLNICWLSENIMKKGGVCTFLILNQLVQMALIGGDSNFSY